jgi:hypothetical protein
MLYFHINIRWMILLLSDTLWRACFMDSSKFTRKVGKETAVANFLKA